MSSSHESAESTTTDVSAEADRIRLTRIEVTPADLTIFSAITGHAPSTEERERALTWAENDPANVATKDGEGVIVSASAPSHMIVPMQPMKFWNPASLKTRVRDLWLNGIELRVARPQINNWFQKLSTAIQQGRKRISQSR